MGCFDSVMAPCPQCGTLNEFQSKGGDCLQRYYVFGKDLIPEDVMTGIHGRETNVNQCSKCGTDYTIDVDLIPRVNLEIGFDVKARPVTWPHYESVSAPTYPDALELNGWPPEALGQPVRCVNCCHWDQAAGGREGWGVCGHARQAEGTPGMLITSHGQEDPNALLQTNADFGCLKFEPK